MCVALGGACHVALSIYLLGENSRYISGHLTAYIWLMPCRHSTHITREIMIESCYLAVTSDIRERCAT